jgi:hypothetical protein
VSWRPQTDGPSKASDGRQDIDRHVIGRGDPLGKKDRGRNGEEVDDEVRAHIYGPRGRGAEGPRPASATNLAPRLTRKTIGRTRSGGGGVGAEQNATRTERSGGGRQVVALSGERAPSVPHPVTRLLLLLLLSLPLLLPPPVYRRRESGELTDRIHGRRGQCRVARRAAAERTGGGGDGGLRARPERGRRGPRRGSGGRRPVPRLSAGGVTGGSAAAAARLARRLPRDHRAGTCHIFLAGS